MKKFWLTITIIWMVALTMLIAKSEDEQMYVPSFGDIESYGKFVADQELNPYWSYEEQVIQGYQTVQGGKNIIYDVMIESPIKQYSACELVTMKITIRNMGDLPDKDTVLYYYLSKGNKTYSKSKMQFLEVPPINSDEITCKKGNGLIDKNKNCVGVFTKRTFLPCNAGPGEWNVNAYYETTVQDPILVYDHFEVIDSNLFFSSQFIIPGVMVFFVCALLIYAAIKTTKKVEGDFDGEL